MLKKSTTLALLFICLHALTGMGQPVAKLEEGGPYPTYRGEDILLLCVVSKDRVYAGEPFTVTYKLLTSRTVSEAEVLHEPSFPALKAVNISRPGSTTLETHHGREYRATVLKHVLLTSDQAQILTLPPFQLAVQVEMPAAQTDFFLRQAYKKYRLASAARDVTVEPLPKGDPLFSGAIGRYNLKATVKQDTVLMHASINYRVEIEGTGNGAGLLPPKLHLPANVEVYPPSFHRTEKVTPKGYRVSYVYDYTLVPTKAGTLILPALPFMYFDPQDGAYKSLHTTQHVVTVRPQQALRQEGSEELQAKLKLIPGEGHRLTQKRTLTATASLYLLIIIVSSIGFAAHLFLAPQLRKAIQQAYPLALARRRLGMLPVHSQDGQRVACQQILDIITTFLSVQFKTTKSMSFPEITQMMVQWHIPDQAIRRLGDIMAQCNEMAYGPAGKEIDLASMRRGTLNVLREINQAIR